MGQGPKYKVTIKSKADRAGKRLPIMAIFEGERGLYAKVEGPYQERPGVVGLLLSNGKTVKFDDYWLDVYEQAPKEPPPRRPMKEGGNDIPF